MEKTFILNFSIEANSSLTITLPIESYNNVESVITNINWDATSNIITTI